MGEMMTVTSQTIRNVHIPDQPLTWGPPDAPLDMPCQVLEDRSSLFELIQWVRLIFMGQQV